MAAYVKLIRAIWKDEDFKALAGEEQRVYLMLISQADISHVGVLPLMPARWARLSADASPDSLRSSLTKLADARFVVLDYDTEAVLARTYLVHDEAYRLTNGKKSLLSAYARVLSEHLQNTIAPLLATVGVTVEPTVSARVDSSQQPAAAAAPTTNTDEPAAAASTDGSADNYVEPDEPEDVAAAALDLLIEYRVACTARTNPDGLRAKLRRELPDEHGKAIGKYLKAHPNATTADVCADVLKMPGIGTTTTAKVAPTFHLDPGCDLHGADGMVNMPDGGAGTIAPCPCRRAEPYPEPPLASVTELRPA